MNIKQVKQTTKIIPWMYTAHLHPSTDIKLQHIPYPITTPRGFEILKSVIHNDFYFSVPKIWPQTGMKIAKNIWKRPVSTLENIRR